MGTPTRRFTQRAFSAAAIGCFLLAGAAFAQDSDSVPLGDLARTLRKKPAETQKVIDNDNMTQVLDQAEVQRRSGTQLTFSVDAASNQFRVTSPDVTCSLSFSSKATSLITDPLMMQELPAAELAKLDGPAVIDGDALQITLANGSQWDVHEIMLSLTTVRESDPAVAAAYFGSARLVPATSEDYSQSGPPQKRRDETVLYKVHRDIKPGTSAVLRTSLTVPPVPGQEWHWAIIRAKGSAPTPTDAAVDPTMARPSAGTLAPVPVQSR